MRQVNEKRNAVIKKIEKEAIIIRGACDEKKDSGEQYNNQQN